MAPLQSNPLKAMLVICGLAVGFLSVTAWVLGSAGESPYEVSMLLLTSAPSDCADDPCTADCGDDTCYNPEYEEHAYTAYGDSWEQPEFSIHPCYLNSSCEGCEKNHEECGTSEEEEEALVLALETLQGEDLQRLINRNLESLLWNPERQSVQLWGCGEQINVSIMLRDEQLESLTDN